MRKKTLPEIMIWCENILEEEIFDIDDGDNYLSETINLFYRIYEIVQIDNEHNGDIDDGFKNHVYNNILHVNEKEYLPISVFPYVAPTISTSFILHIMLLLIAF